MLTQEQQIFEQIKKANHILISFPRSASGDSVASSLALFLFLKKLGKKVEIASSRIDKNTLKLIDSKKGFSFLPAFDEIKCGAKIMQKFVISLDTTKAKINQIKYKLEDNVLNFIISPKEGSFTHDDISSSNDEYKYDLIISLDAPDLESLGEVYDENTGFFYKTPIINIDHHSDNENFGQINSVDINAVSTSEILFSIMENYSSESIDEDIATCLLAGIIQKTKSFKTPNITPRTLLTTSQLISLGARREEIINNLYRSRDLNILKLWGRVLARLSGDIDNNFIWSRISHIDFVKTESGEENLAEVIDELIVNIPQANIIAIIYEKVPKAGEENQNKEELNFGTTGVMIYSTKNVNSFDLIKEYNPTGDKRFAMAEVNKTIQVAEQEIVDMIKEKLRKMPL